MKQSQFLLVISFLAAFFSNGAKAQIMLRNDVPVIHQGDTLHNAWAGGFNCPQFSTLDLNLDGLLDLFVFDRSEDAVITFVNTGTASVPVYTFAPEYIPLFPDSMIEWVLLRDYDGDGDEDIWTAIRTSRLMVYHNDRDLTGGTLSWSLPYPEMKSRYPSNLALYTARSDIPGIEDYDHDGDLDFFTFEVLGVTMEWHKNEAVDSAWGADSLAFRLQSACFGHFNELSTCGGQLNQPPCAAGMRTEAPTNDPPSPGTRHTGSSILPIDLNSDSLSDFILGDASCSNLYALYNNGTTSIAHFGSQELLYPSANIPVQIDTFLASFYVDVDGDNVKDLLVSPNTTQFAEDRYTVWYYHNAGQNDNPDFQLVKKYWLQDEMIDVGSGSAPAFFDYDQDNLLDMLVANEAFYTGGGSKRSALFLYRNSGTATHPSYTLLDSNYLGLATLPAFASVTNLVPTLGDIDNDNDEDLLLGCDQGTIYHFKNNGGAGTANFSAANPNFEAIDVGFHSAPFLYDLNGDSDLDLVIGNQKGRILYYENVGSASSYNYDSTNGTFGNIKISDFTGSSFSFGHAIPFVGDHDNDGDIELLIGTIEGEVQIYGDITLTPGDSFTYEGNLFNNYDFGYYSAVTGAHIDTNSTMSLVIGSFKGGLRHLGPPSIPTEIIKQHPAAIHVDLFPNPAQTSFNVRLTGPMPSGFTTLSVYSLTGHCLMNATFNGRQHSLSTTSLSPGVYFVKVENEQGSAGKKLVIIQ